MAVDWRERLARAKPAPRGVMAEDFRFTPADYPSLRAYAIAHEVAGMMPVPLAVERIVHLLHGSDALRVELDLCLEGADAAAALLARHLGAFQRVVPEAAIVDLATLGVGDAGAAWSWGPEERNGVAGFVRRNVVTFLQGRYDGLIEQARELDAALARLRTAEAYADDSAALFTPPATKDADGAWRVEPAARLDLGAPARGQGDYFFEAQGGAVNRDRDDPGRYYFRAGLQPGRHRIAVFHVGGGLLPARQTLAVLIG